MIHPYLDSLFKMKLFRDGLKLEGMRELVKILDNPQSNYKTIHVAGTNGKGGTSFHIANILQEAGYKVGLYTSPHLIKFNERVRINGTLISDGEIIGLVDSIKDKMGSMPTTFFEFTTALAFKYFSENKVDYAVIEVGLGGRLDATNVINPEVSVITNVSLDHTNILGSSVEEITKEKAGIIKENVPLVTGVPSLPGHFVEGNEAQAWKVIELLDLGISEEQIQKGLKKVWPGRLHQINEHILVDCAHNVAGINKLAEYIKDKPRDLLILGISQDKDMQEMVKIIAPLFSEVVVAEGNYKPIPAQELAKEVGKYTKVTIANPLEAIQNRNVVITGSIYLVGDLLEQLENQGIYKA